MYLKQFRTVQVRVPDPMKPSRKTFEDRLIPTGGTQISHGGKIYDADEEGWFDLPFDAANHLASFRSPNGEKFYSPEQVDEQVRIGALKDEEEAPALPVLKHLPKKKAKAAV